MDVFRCYVQFKESHQLPDIDTIVSAFRRQQVLFFELIAMMYSYQSQAIPFDRLKEHLGDSYAELSSTMLTNTVNDIICKIVPDDDVGNVVVEPMVEDSACERHWSDIAATYFYKKSQTRVQALSAILHATVDIRWVHAVASKVVGDDEDIKLGKYEILTDSDRHIHRVSASVSTFLQSLAGNTVKTFSFHEDAPDAIHLPTFRKALRAFTNDIVPFTIVACSIGMPTYKMYSPATFLKTWRRYRFQNITHDTVIKTILRPICQKYARDNAEIAQLLNEYSARPSVSRTATATVDEFFFKHWFSYATAEQLESIADKANAMKQREIGI